MPMDIRMYLILYLCARLGFFLLRLLPFWATRYETEGIQCVVLLCRQWAVKSYGTVESLYGGHPWDPPGCPV